MKMENLAVRLFYLWMFLFPWQTRWIFQRGEINGELWEYGHLGIFATEILLWLVAILFFVGGGWQKIKSDFLFCWHWMACRWWVFVGTVLLVINIAAAENYLLAVQQWRFWLEAGLVIYLFRRLGIDKIWVLKIFLAGLFTQTALAWWQFFTQSTFASRFLGLTQHLPWMAGTAVLENDNGLWLRAYGGLPHPNVLGGYLAAGLLLFLAWISVEKKKIRRGWFWLAGALISGLMVSFSRSAFLALFLACVALFVVLDKVEARRRLLYLVMSLAMFTALWVVILWPLVSGRLTAQDRLEQWSLAERQSSWKISTQIIKNNFWLGIGLGNYTLAVAQAEKPSWMNLARHYQPVHNIFLLGLAESGIWLFIYGLISFVWIWRRQPKAKWRIWAGLATFFITIGLLDHYLVSLYCGILFLAIMIGLLEDYEHFSTD